MKGIVRPEPVVLADSATVPDRNWISPAPNQFTHELARRQPFYFTSAQQGGPPDGELPAGTKVALLFHDGGPHCRVADGRGLYVEIEIDALKKL